MLGYIYKWENLINGKVYIGQTNNVKFRYDKHISDVRIGKGHGIHAAIRKYGLENFRFMVICSVLDEKDLNGIEILLIREYNSFGNQNGYNLTTGGLGVRGRTVSEETRRKIGDAHRGEKSPNYGKKLSNEHAELLRRTNTGKKRSVEHREAIRASKLGVPRSEETKEKLRAANIGNKASDETKQKLSEARKGAKNHNYGKKLSADECQRISEMNKGRFAGEKHRYYGKERTLEDKIKMSAGKANPIILDAVLYASAYVAALALNIPKSRIKYMLKTGKARYINKLTGEPIITNPQEPK